MPQGNAASACEQEGCLWHTTKQAYLFGGGNFRVPKINAEKILSQFPGPVLLRPSLAKWSRMLLFFACMVLGGLWGLANRIEPIWASWILTAVSSTMMALTVVVPGFLSLRLDADGFTTGGIWGRSLVRWQDANHFQAVEPYPWFQLVAFDLAGSKKGRFASVLQGHTHCLGENFGLAADELLSL